MGYNVFRRRAARPTPPSIARHLNWRAISALFTLGVPSLDPYALLSTSQ